MNNPKISLIFACYNVSSYLNELYQLLVSQSYKNIEIIFVEDCSTDNTKDILRSFSDNRVILIENGKNQGAALSRNTGIENASGDYLWFPDPDDLFDVMLIDKMAQAINQFKPTVLLCGMREDYEYNGQFQYSKNIISDYFGVINSDFNNVLVNLEETYLFGYTNNKFYSARFIKNNNISNKKLALKEDFEFNIQVFSVLSEFYILNEPLYFYKKRNNSSLTTKFVADYWDIHKNSVFLFRALLEKRATLLSLEAKGLLVNRFFRFFISAIERNSHIESKMSFKEQKEWILVEILDKNSELYFERIELLTGKFKYLAPLFRMKMINSLVLLGNMIKLFKKNLPILFSKVKG